MTYKCVIVDDERLAQNILENYIQSTPDLSLVCKCDSALQALAFMNKNEVDILFLDINMPELSGLDLLETLPNAPKVILTTAHSEHALAAFELGVSDYLLKPFSLKRFLKAVNRIINTSHEHEMDSKASPIPQRLMVREDGIAHHIFTKDIQYVEGCGNYVLVHTLARKFMVRETMHDMEKQLNEQPFTRSHKSFIVNLEAILRVEGNWLHLEQATIPIGRSYKPILYNRLKLE